MEGAPFLAYGPYIKRTWTEVHVRIVLQGGSAWFCADKSAEMRVDWVGVRVRWGM